MARQSFRARLRAFQDMRGEPPDRGFIADLEHLENRDLDLSIRIGAMLAFNALAVMVGTYPVSSSPGAPLSLDAATEPLLTILSLVGVAPVVVSSYLCLKALLLGEEFDSQSLEGEALRQRLFAAFVRSVDVQSRLLRSAVRWTLCGGTATLASKVSTSILRILLARVRSALRRHSGVAAGSGVLRIAGLAIDLEGYDLRRDGQAISLTARDHAVLRELARQPGRVRTHAQLLSAV